MKIDILTLFPGMFGPVINESILKRAQEKRLVNIHIHNIRDYSKDKHKKVDDKPYGGGPGMVMEAEPIFLAVEKLKKPKTRVVLLTPQGEKLTHDIARKLAGHGHLVLLCGHYEGIDERVREAIVTDEISIGDYVLTCGELPAMVLLDALARLVPGVLGDETSNEFDSFSHGLLEYPHYTRPREFRSMKVPPVLFSGDHEKIKQWRHNMALERTKKRRPDLLHKKHVKGKGE
ncbi:MAG: tRNA (guanosine(37)-N1)-methyltransferase TrmD [Candidatus Omnitrophota bacterium]